MVQIATFGMIESSTTGFHSSDKNVNEFLKWVNSVGGTVIDVKTQISYDNRQYGVGAYTVIADVPEDRC